MWRPLSPMIVNWTGIWSQNPESSLFLLEWDSSRPISQIWNLKWKSSRKRSRTILTHERTAQKIIKKSKSELHRAKTEGFWNVLTVPSCPLLSTFFFFSSCSNVHLVHSGNPPYSVLGQVDCKYPTFWNFMIHDAVQQITYRGRKADLRKPGLDLL